MIPLDVKELSDFLKERNIWHNISYNHNAMSCNDAANKRRRLGHEGIPLNDELKSIIGYYKLNGKKQIVVLHCRGTQFLDESKVSDTIGASIFFLSKSELDDRFKLGYGLINPFSMVKDFPDTEHYFDHSIFDDYFPPYTMMTNSGHHNWAIEFKPIELSSIIQNMKVSNIVRKNNKSFSKPVIGILTGNSPESGILLWEQINSNIRISLGDSFLGDISFPRVIVESVPEMGLSMELDLRENQTRKIVLESVESLCKNGANIIAVACNTTQYFSEEIRKICMNYNAHFISMEEALVETLTQENIHHFDFMGISFVTDFNKWSGFKRLNTDFNVEIPKQYTLDKINELAFNVKKSKVSNSAINKLRDLIGCNTKTNNIVIALTEISILLASQKKKSKNGHRFFDTLSILAQSVSNFYLAQLRKSAVINIT